MSRRVAKMTGITHHPRVAEADIDLYYWPTPNGWKVAILLEELGVPYALKPVDIRRGDQFAPEFLLLSPNNKIPAIVDRRPAGGGAPIAIFESGAILLYLAEKYQRLCPTAPARKYEVVQWVFWQVAGLGPIAGQVHHFREYVAEPVPYAAERFTNEINRLYGVLDNRLRDAREYIAGEYSIADIACWVWCRLWRHHGQDLQDFPHLSAWLSRVGERPAVQMGFRVGNELREGKPTMTPEARQVLLGQTAGRR